MSGGSCDYVCFAIENDLCGKFPDAELNDLARDFATLAHELEWYLSCDISKKAYLSEAKKFKEKWFKASREERLKKYIDEACEKTKNNLLEMLEGQ